MKFMIIMMIMFLTTGCAHVKITTTLEDGTPVSAEYTRWFNQNIDGLKIRTPKGIVIQFDKQKSDIELALEFSGLKASAGGN